MDPTTRTSSILIVDDEDMVRRMLAQFVRRMGHNPVVATNGQEALDALAAGYKPDLVLLDVDMPVMDGWTALHRIRELRSSDELPVIILSGKSDIATIGRFIEAGAEDYLTKPFEASLLRSRLRASLERTYARILLRQSHARMERDLRAAAKIQRSIFPPLPVRLPGLNVHWEYQPCNELAGDSLGVFRLDERYVGFYVLDVSGHGVPSALLAVSVSHVLSPLLGQSILKRPLAEPPWYRLALPAEVVEHLNSAFPMDPKTNQYFTFLYAMLDMRTLQVRLVSAGHPNPLHCSEQGVSEIALESGFPVGWVDNATYLDTTVALKPGDRLIFFTDGLSEALNLDNDQFGVPRLVDQVTAMRKEGQDLQPTLRSMIEKVNAWAINHQPDDDLTVLGIEVLPQG